MERRPASADSLARVESQLVRFIPYAEEILLRGLGDISEMAGQKIDLERRHTLQQAFPRAGWISLLFSLGNVGLQIYSHLGVSAEILSSVPPVVEGGGGGGGGCGIEDVCVKQSNFNAWWSASGQEEFPNMGQQCGVQLIFGGEEGFVKCLTDNFGFQGDSCCSKCFAIPVNCVRDNCLSPCLADSASQACTDCVLQFKCNLLFETCTGVSISSNGTGRLLEAAPTLYPVYSISFVDSVRDAANGDAWAIAIVLVLFSGIWPYLKNVIMMVAWFVPMTAATRCVVLKNLTRFAKWSLVDVFAVVIIVAGVYIDVDIGGKRLLVVAESRVAIYTFCIGAVWDLCQGEWMRFKHFELMRELGSEKVHDLSLSTSVVNQVTFEGDRKCSLGGKRLLLGMSVVHLALAISSMFVVCIGYDIGGKLLGAGTIHTEYSAWSIASTLLSSDRKEINTAFAGTVFLVIIYLLMSIFVPIFQYASFMRLSFLRGAKLCCEEKGSLLRFYEAVDIIGGFACLDVFLLSFVVVTAEWDRLLAKALDGELEKMGGTACTGSDCLTMSATIMTGIWLMIPAVVLGWIAEVVFTYQFAQFVQPYERDSVTAKFVGSSYWTTKEGGKPLTQDENAASVPVAVPGDAPVGSSSGSDHQVAKV